MAMKGVIVEADATSAVQRAFRLPLISLLLASAVLIASLSFGVAVGAADVPFGGIIRSLIDHIPFVSLSSGLTDTQETILWQWRIPRLLLGALVGSSLAVSGAAYQGVFRNPLADPFLLGAAAGAGLGATLVIVTDTDRSFGPLGTVPLAAFLGALLGVGISAMLGRSAGRSTASLLLAGVASAAFLTACQTFLMQRHVESIQEVYGWLIGRLSTSGWTEVNLLFPYFVVCGMVIFLHRRQLDVLRLGDDEAKSLGIRPGQVRLLVILAASFLTAAAVAVSGLIAFVGIVVPHVVRLAVGSSYRVVIPLSAILGAAFLSVGDVAARTALSPAELPIGVVTAFVGAPFFAVVLWRTRGQV